MNTIIYGISSPTELYLKSSYNTGKNIFACTSGDEYYQGEKAISLVELAEIPHESIDKIVVCSMFFTDICNAFNKHNVPLELVYFFDHARGILLPYNQVTSAAPQAHEILYAVYDLSVHLPCFDVLNFVVLAELERVKKNKKFIHFIVMHNTTAENGRCAMLFHEKNDYLWRLEKIIKVVFTCLPSYVATSDFLFKDEAFTYLQSKECIYPDTLLVEKKSPVINTLSLRGVNQNSISLSVLRAPKNAQETVDTFLLSLPKDVKPIVITLREYKSQPKRNSDIDEWAKFLDSLDHTKYCPIIVRDTYLSAEKPSPKLEKYLHFPHASTDFAIRLALYERAYINMGVSSGPNYSISFIKGARSIIFQMIDENNPACSSWTAERSGLSIGEDFFFNDSSLQKTVWEKDSFLELKSAFTDLVNKIENNQLNEGSQ